MLNFTLRTLSNSSTYVLQIILHMSFTSTYMLRQAKQQSSQRPLYKNNYPV